MVLVLLSGVSRGLGTRLIGPKTKEEMMNMQDCATDGQSAAIGRSDSG